MSIFHSGTRRFRLPIKVVKWYKVKEPCTAMPEVDTEKKILVTPEDKTPGEVIAGAGTNETVPAIFERVSDEEETLSERSGPALQNRAPVSEDKRRPPALSLRAAGNLFRGLFLSALLGLVGYFGYVGYIQVTSANCLERAVAAMKIHDYDRAAKFLDQGVSQYGSLGRTERAFFMRQVASGRSWFGLPMEYYDRREDTRTAEFVMSWLRKRVDFAQTGPASVHKAWSDYCIQTASYASSDEVDRSFGISTMKKLIAENEKHLGPRSGFSAEPYVQLAELESRRFNTYDKGEKIAEGRASGRRLLNIALECARNIPERGERLRILQRIHFGLANWCNDRDRFDVLESALPLEHGRSGYLQAHGALAKAYLEAHRYDDALRVAKEQLRLLDESGRHEPHIRRYFVDELVGIYDAMGRKSEADALRPQGRNFQRSNVTEKDLESNR